VCTSLFNQVIYRDKKVVGVFVRFRAPLQCDVIGHCGNEVGQ
jgi:hypothetical protein